jgi:hypothetical protein
MAVVAVLPPLIHRWCIYKIAQLVAPATFSCRPRHPSQNYVFTATGGTLKSLIRRTINATVVRPRYQQIAFYWSQ